MATTTVIETFKLPDGSVAQGTVTFSLSAPSYHSGLGRIVTDDPIVATLDGTGAISVALEPTDSGSWSVAGLTYKVVERIDGLQAGDGKGRTYYVQVPTSGSSVKLGALAQWPAAPITFTGTHSALAGLTTGDDHPQYSGRMGLPEVWDEFSAYANGAVSGKTPVVGNAWVVSGAQLPTVTAGRAYSSGIGYLFNTMQSASAMLTCEVTFTGTDPTQSPMTMALGKNAVGSGNELNDVLHVNFGPRGFTATVRKDSGTFDYLLGSDWRQDLRMDDTTVYRVSIIAYGDSLVVLGPQGEVYDITDRRIALVKGTTAVWEPNTIGGGTHIAKLVSVGGWSEPSTGKMAAIDIITRTGAEGVAYGALTAGSRMRYGMVRIGADDSNAMPSVQFGAPRIITYLTSAASSGTATLTCAERIPNGSSIQIESGTNSETVTADASAPGGTGPFTRVLSANLTKTHAVGAAVIATPPGNADMYFNVENGFFFLPNKAALIAPAGSVYLGSSIDTVIQQKAADVAGMGTGDSFQVDGTWNGGRLRLGTYHLWVDGSGRLRIKSSAPASDTDGTVVGTQV